MIEQAEARVRRMVAARLPGVVARVAARVREAVPGVGVAEEDGRVVIEGRGLRRRLATDAALRWIGGLLR